jgi:hypothetical protein
VIFQPEKTFISRHILHQLHWYTCPMALPVRRNPQRRSFWLSSQPLPHLRFNLFVISEIFTTKVVFSGPNRWKSLGAKSGLKGELFKKFPLQFLNSLLGCSGCMGSGILMMKQYSSCQWPGSFLRIASRSSNRTSQYDAEFTFSSRFWKFANSTPWEWQNT